MPEVEKPLSKEEIAQQKFDSLRSMVTSVYFHKGLSTNPETRQAEQIFIQAELGIIIALASSFSVDQIREQGRLLIDAWTQTSKPEYMNDCNRYALAYFLATGEEMPLSLSENKTDNPDTIRSELLGLMGLLSGDLPAEN